MANAVATAGDLEDVHAPGARPVDAAQACIALGEHWLVLQRTAAGGILRLFGRDGAAPLTVEITAAGPVLRLGSGLAILADGALSLAADTIELSARRGVRIASGDGIELCAAGELRAEAAGQSLIARQGDVVVRANDDVRLNGERIKLNC